MRGPKHTASARTASAGHAFVRNLRHGHYAITAEVPIHDHVHLGFAELTPWLLPPRQPPAHEPVPARSIRRNAAAPSNLSCTRRGDRKPAPHALVQSDWCVCPGDAIDAEPNPTSRPRFE